MVASYTTPQNNFRYHYDTFDRLRMKIGDKHAIEYTYVANSRRVASYSISQADASYITYSYTYNAVGNITSIKKNGTTVSNYEYDSLGRLVREDDCASSTSWVYTYDNAGNILQKYTFYGMSGVPACHLLSLHPYNGSEISGSYTYSTSAWGDLLTNYNGTTISYDEVGNPLNWRNATNMQWHQRSLLSMSVGGTSVSYTYNADGIRTTKAHDHIGHVYLLTGATILKETIYNAGTVMNTLYYYYDESGISGLEYNGTKFTYIKNLQGDVIAIINSNGVTVVEYKYDAWGKVLSITGSMASTLGAVNPFRYRSYYYDTETGLYYVSSRYYDPEIGRWINADTTDVLSLPYYHPGQYNLFSYCNNNPVNDRDDDGQLSWLAKIAIGAAAIAVGVGVTALTGGAALPALVAGVKAACVAGAISAGTSAAKTAVRSAASGDSFSTIVQKSAKSAVDGFADGFMAGGIAAGASQVASGGFKIAAKLGAKTGKSGGIKLGNTKILSPDAVWQKNNGGTLLKIGKTFRIDVGSNTLLHMHIPKVSSHIQIGTIGAGIYGGLK